MCVHVCICIYVLVSHRRRAHHWQRAQDFSISPTRLPQAQVSRDFLAMASSLRMTLLISARFPLYDFFACAMM